MALSKKANRPTVLGQFTGKCCDGNVENNNQMTLPVELFQNLIASDEYKAGIENRHYIGFLGHPQDPGCQDFKDACIVMTEMKLEDNGEVTGTFDLIDTPVGRVVKSFIDAGVTFGISIRGAGDVDGNGYVDPDTFCFRGYDLVTFPAYNDAIPTFTEIAASSDLDKQVKYKKVCSTVNKNLQSITSATTLDTLKEQFNENSDEYKAIEDRKKELNDAEHDDNDELQDIQTPVTAEQVEGMTQLYLEQVEANSQLQREVDQLRVEIANIQANYNRKLKSMKRITAAQISGLTADLKKSEGARKTLIAANTRLKQEQISLKKSNLNLSQKINANSVTINEKTSTISRLQSELSETVACSKRVESRTSNLGEQVKNLQEKVTAAEDLIYEYQKAYADLYANALGVHLTDIPVTATTTVDELTSIVNSGTSTCNMMPANIDVADIDNVYEEDTSDIYAL